MNNSPTSTGHSAEDLVSRWLESSNYQVVAQNWRTRRCEIDIVAAKDKVVYFVEVKYRSSAGFGSGLEYITAKKLEQMLFSANMWLAINNWSGDYRICAAEVDAFEDINFVEDVI